MINDFEATWLLAKVAQEHGVDVVDVEALQNESMSDKEAEASITALGP